MKIEDEYCPDCCIKLEQVKKKLDYSMRRNWLSCPRCGYTKRPVTHFEKQAELENFEKTHKLSKYKQSKFKN